MLRTIDISNWQRGLDIASTGAEAVICKATQGTTIVDPSCDVHYQSAKQLGLKLGVYHYASGGDPIEEADFFVNNIQGYIGEAILVLDWERNQNPRFSEGSDWCLAFLRQVEERTGVKPLIYMSASVIRSYNWDSVVNNGNGLWVAGYPDFRDSWNPPAFNFNISPWKFMALWQYTNSNGRLDRDIFYGDKVAWDKYATSNKVNDKVNNEKDNTMTIPVEDTTNKPEKVPVEIVKNNLLQLPQPLYEVLRWIVWVVLPALGVFLGLLNKAWGWGLPMEAILQSLSGLELFLGTILGLAKLSLDN